MVWSIILEYFYNVKKQEYIKKETLKWNYLNFMSPSLN
jgi:hypothetical protein